MSVTGEVGVLEQPASEVGAVAPRQLVGRGADVLDEEPPEVAHRHAERRAEVGLRTPVERAVGDQVHRPAHQLRAGDDSGACRCGRHRRHARNPAASASAAERYGTTWPGSGRAEHDGTQ